MSIFKSENDKNEILKVGMQGANFMVNPSRDLTLERLEGRAKTIREALEQNKYYTEEKRAKLEKSLKRYEFEILLRKGEM